MDDRKSEEEDIRRTKRNEIFVEPGGTRLALTSHWLSLYLYTLAGIAISRLIL